MPRVSLDAAVEVPIGAQVAEDLRRAGDRAQHVASAVQLEVRDVPDLRDAHRTVGDVEQPRALALEPEQRRGALVERHRALVEVRDQRLAALVVGM